MGACLAPVMIASDQPLFFCFMAAQYVGGMALDAYVTIRRLPDPFIVGIDAQVIRFVVFGWSAFVFIPKYCALYPPRMIYLALYAGFTILTGAVLAYSKTFEFHMALWHTSVMVGSSLWSYGINLLLHYDFSVSESTSLSGVLCFTAAFVSVLLGVQHFQ